MSQSRTTDQVYFIYPDPETNPSIIANLPQFHTCSSACRTATSCGTTTAAAAAAAACSASISPLMTPRVERSRWFWSSASCSAESSS